MSSPSSDGHRHLELSLWRTLCGSTQRNTQHIVRHQPSALCTNQQWRTHCKMGWCLPCKRLSTLGVAPRLVGLGFDFVLQAWPVLMASSPWVFICAFSLWVAASQLVLLPLLSMSVFLRTWSGWSGVTGAAGLIWHVRCGRLCRCAMCTRICMHVLGKWVQIPYLHT